jgi:hypothetical protein
VRVQHRSTSLKDDPSPSVVEVVRIGDRRHLPDLVSSLVDQRPSGNIVLVVLVIW